MPVPMPTDADRERFLLALLREEAQFAAFCKTLETEIAKQKDS